MRRQDFKGNKLDFAIGGTMLFVVVGLLMARSAPPAAATPLQSANTQAVHHSAPVQQSVWQGYEAENPPTSAPVVAAQDNAMTPTAEAVAAPTQTPPAQPPVASDPIPYPVAIIFAGNGDNLGNYAPDGGQMNYQVDALGNPVGVSVAYPMDDGTYLIERYQSNQSYGPVYQQGQGSYSSQPVPDNSGDSLPGS